MIVLINLKMIYSHADSSHYGIIRRNMILPEMISIHGWQMNLVCLASCQRIWSEQN